jgi:hypothetical protein
METMTTGYCDDVARRMKSASPLETDHSGAVAPRIGVESGIGARPAGLLKKD